VRRLWIMTLSDLRQRIRDRSVLIFALVVPRSLRPGERIADIRCCHNQRASQASAAATAGSTYVGTS